MGDLDESPIGGWLALLILVSVLSTFTCLCGFSSSCFCCSRDTVLPELPLHFLAETWSDLPLLFPLATWCRAIGGFMPGHFHSSTSTLGSNFFTFMCYAAIPTFQVYWAFALHRLPSVIIQGV